MGICISRASPEIHEINYGHDNNIFYQHAASDKRIGSIRTHQGSKGFNQDATILYQDYGMEDGAFGGVFDGHGRNGQIASKFMRNKMPSLITKERNSIIAKGKTVNIMRMSPKISRFGEMSVLVPSKSWTRRLFDKISY